MPTGYSLQLRNGLSEHPSEQDRITHQGKKELLLGRTDLHPTPLHRTEGGAPRRRWQWIEDPAEGGSDYAAAARKAGGGELGA